MSNTVTNILGIVPLWERAKPIVQGIPESDPTKADPGRLKGQITIDRAFGRSIPMPNPDAATGRSIWTYISRC